MRGRTGIVLFAGPLSAWLTPIMPAFIAQNHGHDHSRANCSPCRSKCSSNRTARLLHSGQSGRFHAPFVGFSTLAGLCQPRPSHGYCQTWDPCSPTSRPGTAIMELGGPQPRSGERHHSMDRRRGGAADHPCRNRRIYGRTTCRHTLYRHHNTRTKLCQAGTTHTQSRRTRESMGRTNPITRSKP